MSGETGGARAEASGEKRPQPERRAESRSSRSRSAEPAADRRGPISPWVIAPFSGAVAAALVIAVGWLLGWPAVQAPPAAPQVERGRGRRSRQACRRARSARSAKPVADPAMTARIDTLEKSLASLRGDLANLRAQSDKLAAAVNEAKSAPRPTRRVRGRSLRHQRAHRPARATRSERSQPREARRLPRASRRTTCRSAASSRRRCSTSRSAMAIPMSTRWPRRKALAPDAGQAEAARSLCREGRADPPALTRELLTLVPKLSPAAESPTTGSGIVDRLQAGASKLVRIERTDAAGNDRSADRRARHRGGAAQRFRRGAARTGIARCRRPRAGAGLARQGRCARRRARRVPSIRRRGNGLARANPAQ